MPTPKSIRVNGHLYHLAMEPAPTVQSPQVSAAGKTLQLKADILGMLFDLGVGKKMGSGTNWVFAPVFMPLPGDVSLETLLNIVNNYVMRTGEGKMPQQASERVADVLADARDAIDDVLIPTLTELRQLFNQFVAGIPDLGYTSPTQYTPTASASFPLLKLRISFRGATYRRLWLDVQTAGLQRIFEGATLEDVDQVLDMLDLGRLQDLYSYLHKSIRQSIRSISGALSTFFDKVAAVTNHRDRVTDQYLIMAIDHIAPLLEQLDAASRVLNRITALEEEQRVEMEAIKARDTARRDERAQQEFKEDELRAKGRGRPRKVRPEDSPTSSQDM